MLRMSRRCTRGDGAAWWRVRDCIARARTQRDRARRAVAARADRRVDLHDDTPDRL